MDIFFLRVLSNPYRRKARYKPLNHGKDEYIKLISALSDRYGDKLLALMEFSHVSNLQQVTLEQAKSFYETRCTA